MTKYKIKRLQIFQNKAVYRVARLPDRMPSLHRETNMLTIKEFIESITEKEYTRTVGHYNSLVAQLGQ